METMLVPASLPEVRRGRVREPSSPARSRNRRLRRGRARGRTPSVRPVRGGGGDEVRQRRVMAPVQRRRRGLRAADAAGRAPPSSSSGSRRACRSPRTRAWSRRPLGRADHGVAAQAYTMAAYPTSSQLEGNGARGPVVVVDGGRQAGQRRLRGGPVRGRHRSTGSASTRPSCGSTSRPGPAQPWPGRLGRGAREEPLSGHRAAPWPARRRVRLRAVLLRERAGRPSSAPGGCPASRSGPRPAAKTSADAAIDVRPAQLLRRPRPPRPVVRRQPRQRPDLSRLRVRAASAVPAFRARRRHGRLDHGRPGARARRQGRSGCTRAAGPGWLPRIRMATGWQGMSVVDTGDDLTNDGDPGRAGRSRRPTGASVGLPGQHGPAAGSHPGSGPARGWQGMDVVARRRRPERGRRSPTSWRGSRRPAFCGSTGRTTSGWGTRLRIGGGWQRHGRDPRRRRLHRRRAPRRPCAGEVHGIPVALPRHVRPGPSAPRRVSPVVGGCSTPWLLQGT